MAEHNPEHMDYAAAAAKNSDQSPEEKSSYTDTNPPSLSSRAPPPPQVIPTTSTTPLVDVDSSSVNVVPSDYLSQDIQTQTQAQRIALEEAEAEAAAAANAAFTNSKKPKSSKKKSHHVSPSSAIAAIQPYLPSLEVVNAILGGAATVALGVAAWRRYNVGDASWKRAGLWGGVVAAVAAVDALGLRFFQQSQKNSKSSK